MRILFISNYYPPYERGGYEQLCRDIAQQLTQRGHEVAILTSNYGVKFVANAREPNVHRVLRLQPDYRSRLSAGAQFFFTRRADEVHNLKQLDRLIDAFQPNVALMWNLEYLPRALAMRAEHTPNLGVAYWLAGRSPLEPDEYWAYWNRRATRSIVAPFKNALSQMALAIMRAERPAMPLMRHTGVVSEYMRRQGIASGALPAHARVIYNGVEPDLFYRPVRDRVAGPLVLLQAGRISADKGVHTTIEAMAHLAHDHLTDRVQLFIAGSGPDDYLAQLQQMVARHHLGDVVTFLGWQARDKMPAVMARCHGLVLPTSHQEPFARVVLEAMANGLAVIGTLTGGTGEILQHDVTGLTFAASDSAALAGQIRRLIDDPDLGMKIARRGQQLVLEQFTLARMADNIAQLLNEAIAERTHT